MRIGQKLVAGLLAIVSLLGMAGFFGLIASGQIIESYESLESQFGPIVMAANNITSTTKRAESHLTRYLMLHNEKDKRNFLYLHKELKEQISELSRQATEHEVTTHLQNLKGLIAKLLPQGSQLIKMHDQEMRRTGKFPLQNHSVRIEQLTKTAAAIVQESQKLVDMKTDHLNQQQTVILANSVQGLAKNMELHLNLYLILHRQENKQKFMDLFSTLQADTQLLATKVKTSEAIALVNRMQGSAQDLEPIGRYLLQACSQDLAINKTFDATRYSKTMEEYYRGSERLRKDAEELARLNTDLLLSKQEKGIKEAKTIQYTILLVIFASILGALGVSYLLTRSIASPILRLREAVMRYGRGQLSTKIDISSKDEVGQLANTFNQMASNLRQTMVSKSFVSAIIESMPETLFVLHPDLRIKMVNNAALKLLGYNKDELIDKPISRIFDDACILKRAQPSEFVKKASEKGCEATYLTRGNRKISVLFSVSPILGHQNQVEEFVCSGKDITAHKQAENRLKQSLKELSDVMFALEQSAILIITDAQGVITHANEQFCNISGYSKHELVGKQGGFTDSNIHSKVLLEKLWSHISKGQVWKGDLRYRAKNGSEYWMNNTIVPFLNDEGVPFQYLAICFDITERKVVETQLIHAKKTAEENSKAKSSFLAKMSHELRTPLNAILGYCELLEEELEDIGEAGYNKDLKKIHSAGSHLLALINDILDLSKVEAGKMELHLEGFDVHSMVDEVVSTIRPLVERNQNNLVIHCDDSVGNMTADFIKTKQVLINLLSNASKFTEQGTITLEAKKHTVNAEDFISFTVKDTGIGIAPGQIDKVFQAFTQAENQTTRKYGGTGLGLAITNRFCEMMGGHIDVTSQLQGGSTFEVHLPCTVTASRENLAAAESTPQSDLSAEAEFS